MKKLLPLPPTFNPDRDDAGNLHEFLSSLGLSIQGVSLTRPFKDVGDDTIFVDILTDADLDDTVFDTYTSQPSEEEQAAQELEQIDIETADLAQLRKAVGLMKQIMNQREPPIS